MGQDVTVEARSERDVLIPAGAVSLRGHLSIPAGPKGVVVFAHGSGSSSASPRNRRVAWWLNQAGMGTLLFDLLTPQEEADRANVFDIALLGQRLRTATMWLGEGLEEPLPLGYFGASTGAAAALWAAGGGDLDVRAIVSRGGRPDLAGSRLGRVTAPTLLIVGERDPVVIELNEQARRQLRARADLLILPGATHLFEEPGAIDQVARLAGGWFDRHFGGQDLRRAGSTA
jgi:putative phosphoribosyl transferase